MDNFRFHLKKGGKKLTCPACGKKGKFVPYVEAGTNIVVDSERKFLGLYKDEVSAAYAYDIEAIKMYGENCKTNFTKWEREILKTKVSSIIIRECQSKYIGVCRQGKKWRSCTTINYKQIKIGVYNTEIEAAQAFNEYVLKNNLNRELNVIG